MPLLTRWRIPLAVLALSVAVYLPVVTFEFVCDDREQIVLSQPYFTWRMLPHYFTSDVWSHITALHTNYYRPVFMVWLMLNAKLFGVETALWHISAIVCHLAATLLFYLLARKLLGSDLTAGVAALLFGVHPVHVEAVAWISGATESLFAMLAFGTLLAHIRWRESSPGQARRWQLASLALFGAAMLAKETAVVLPLLILGYEWLFPSDPGRRLRNGLWALRPHVLVILLYLGMRVYALKSLYPLVRPWTPAMLLGTWPFVLGFYLRQLLAPIQFSMFYPILPVKQLGLTNFVLPLIAVLAAAAVLVFVARRSRTAAFAVLLLLIPVLPVLNLRAFAFDDFLHDRYLYVPAAGFCLLLAMGWGRLRNARVRVALAAAATAALCASTLHASRIWESNLTLYSHALDLAPESTMAQIYMGEELVRQERYAEALPILKKALAGYLQGYQLYNDIARCYIELGDDIQATDYLKDAIQVGPKYPQAYQNLAAIEMKHGDLDQAEAHARQGLALRPLAGPGWDRYHHLIGLILETKGDLKGALAEYRAELRENPDADDVRKMARLLSAKLGVPME